MARSVILVNSKMMMFSDRWREFLVHIIPILKKLKGLREFWRFVRYNNKDPFFLSFVFIHTKV